MDKEESHRVITQLSYRMQDAGTLIRKNLDDVGPVPVAVLKELEKRLKAFIEVAKQSKGIPKSREWVVQLLESETQAVVGYVSEKLKDGKVKYEPDMARFFKVKKDPSLLKYVVITGGAGLVIGGGMKFTRLARNYLGERRAIKQQLRSRIESRRRTIASAPMPVIDPERERKLLEQELKKERAKAAKQQAKAAAAQEKERAAQRARAEEAKKREQAHQKARARAFERERKRAEQKVRSRPAEARQKKPEPVFRDFEDVFTQ